MARFFLAWATSVALSLHAQIPISAGAYSQNFDTLTNSGAVNAWTNNQTLEGWYASRTAGNTEVTNYAAGDGASIVGSLYSLGPAAHPIARSALSLPAPPALSLSGSAL